MQSLKTILTLTVLAVVAAPIAQAAPRGVNNPDRVGLTGWVPTPPTNIRAQPNGKIQCVVRREGRIKLYGSTGIEDHNGEWFYTDYCGKMGMIHSTQFVIPD